ncbi:MAG: response regulator transcription factor [Gammaproteobacteria bacterium]|nr:MAG: response regulator transcription factor [Gammaproteobacteria bacterium]
MQSIFLSPIHIQSPRWSQAFPKARITNVEAEVPSNLGGTLLWVMLSDVFTLSHIAKWVAAGARVIALTQHESSQEAKQVVEAGANGYLHYLAVVPVLEQASQVVEVGGLWLGVDLMRQLVMATTNILTPAATQIKQKNPQAALPDLNNTHIDLLSVREQAVAKAVAAGKSNKEVAIELDITERTVKAHLSSVFEKLNVRDRLHLVLILSNRS